MRRMIQPLPVGSTTFASSMLLLSIILIHCCSAASFLALRSGSSSSRSWDSAWAVDKTSGFTTSVRKSNEIILARASSTSEFFDAEILQQKLNDHFCRIETETTTPTQLSTPQIMHLYKVNDGFAPKDLYWKQQAQIRRFKGSFKRGILYRPEIVQEMATEVENALNEELPCGLLVKGPQGIGKSHSLVNLVRKLLYDSKGKYLVTFIQDCENFYTVGNLYESICNSFGTSTKELQFQPRSFPEDESYNTFVEEIELFLIKENKQWVLIFDQINRLFTNSVAKDVGSLQFPFRAIQSIMKAGRITSIISASANNEATYRDNHDRFKDYNHCVAMTQEEVSAAFKSAITNQLNTIMEVTGGVPLQVQNLINFGFDVDAYEEDERQTIFGSLIKLLDESSIRVSEQITANAVGCCVLALDTPESKNFDRKYSVYNRAARRYETVYPLVLQVYQNFFWNDIMKYVNENEQVLLNICKRPETPNSVRGWFFEWMVVNRCYDNTVGGRPTLTAGGQSFTMPESNLVDRFPTKNLLPTALGKDGVYVPILSNFLAIDFIWKQDCTVWGVQVHVADHEHVLDNFQTMCETANWQGQFNDIYLLYLSPEPEVTDKVRKYKGSELIKVIFASKEDLTCLKDLQWPAGCSIEPKLLKGKNATSIAELKLLYETVKTVCKLDKVTKADLVKQLRMRSQKISGTKEVLARRLLECVTSQSENQEAIPSPQPLA